MNDKNTIVVNRGISSTSLLGIAFVILKLTNTISWSWWWVLSPFWIPIGILFIVFIIMITVYYSIVKSSGKE